MHSVLETEAVVKDLPPSERQRLSEDLFFILPELDVDLVWQSIVNDERP
jgi:hypothetical protein